MGSRRQARAIWSAAEASYIAEHGEIAGNEVDQIAQDVGVSVTNYSRFLVI